MSMNLAMGMVLGQAMARSAGIDDTGEGLRAGVAMGITGMTPFGILLSKTMIDRRADAERKQREDTKDGDDGGSGKPKSSGGGSGRGSTDTSAGASSSSESSKSKSS